MNNLLIDELSGCPITFFGCAHSVGPRVHDELRVKKEVTKKYLAPCCTWQGLELRHRGDTPNAELWNRQSGGERSFGVHDEGDGRPNGRGRDRCWLRKRRRGSASETGGDDDGSIRYDGGTRCDGGTRYDGGTRARSSVLEW